MQLAGNNIEKCRENWETTRTHQPMKQYLNRFYSTNRKQAETEEISGKDGKSI